jgi:hypothetical protein
VKGANHAATRSVPEAPADSPVEAPINIGHLGLTAPAYVRADLSVRSSVEPHEAPLPQLAELVSKIVAIEGPIHVDEIARRITTAFGRARAGGRIVEATDRAVRLAMQRDNALRREGSFLMTEKQSESPPARDRTAEAGNILKSGYLPPSETAAAARFVRQESGDVSEEDLIRAVARLLGFQRVGSDLSVAILQALRPT